MISKFLKEADLHLAFPVGRAFLEEAEWPAPFNEQTFFKFWSGTLKADCGEIFAMIEGGRIVGLIGYAFVNCPFTGDFTAWEQFLWVDRGYRNKGLGLRLWEGFEKRAKERGAVRIMMVHLAGLNLQAVYEKRGYKLAEQVFWKNL